MVEVIIIASYRFRTRRAPAPGYLWACIADRTE